MLTEQLSERLKTIADSAAQLPPEMQDRLAAEFASALENALWDAQLRDPDHLAALRELAERARQERKLPMPKPSDTGDSHLVDPDDLHLLEELGAEGDE